MFYSWGISCLLLPCNLSLDRCNVVLLVRRAPHIDSPRFPGLGISSTALIYRIEITLLRNCNSTKPSCNNVLFKRHDYWRVVHSSKRALNLNRWLFFLQQFPVNFTAGKNIVCSCKNHVIWLISWLWSVQSETHLKAWILRDLHFASCDTAQELSSLLQLYHWEEIEF